MSPKPFTDEQIAEIQRVANDAAYAAQSRFMHKEQISEEIPLDGEALIWDEDRAKFVPSTPTVAGTADHDHDGSPTQQLEAINTHENAGIQQHHAPVVSISQLLLKNHALLAQIGEDDHHDKLHDHDATGYISFGGQSLTTEP